MCRLFLRELAKTGGSLDVYAHDRVDGFPDLESAFDGERNRVFAFPIE